MWPEALVWESTYAQDFHYHRTFYWTVLRLCHSRMRDLRARTVCQVATWAGMINRNLERTQTSSQFSPQFAGCWGGVRGWAGKEDRSVLQSGTSEVFPLIGDSARNTSVPQDFWNQEWNECNRSCNQALAHLCSWWAELSASHLPPRRNKSIDFHLYGSTKYIREKFLNAKMGGKIYREQESSKRVKKPSTKYLV